MRSTSYFCAAGSVLDCSVYIAKLFTFRKGIITEVVESGSGEPRSSHYGVSLLLGPPNLLTTLLFLYFVNFLHHGEGPISEYVDI